MTQYLLVYHLYDATEDELKVWSAIQSSEQKHNTQFLEIISKETHEEQKRLENEGWQLRSTGNGSLIRLSAYSKDN